MPEQDLGISLRRIPARPRSGVVLSGVRPAAGAQTRLAPRWITPAEDHPR